MRARRSLVVDPQAMTGRVVTITPAGRRRYVRILHRYLLRHRDLIDKHVWWVNTVDPDDIAYLERLRADYPGLYETWYHEPPRPAVTTWDIGLFYPRACDPDATYVRIDDDIVWMADDALARLVACRRDNPGPFLVYGNIINNAICNYIHQKLGAIGDEVGRLTWACNCPLGWKDPLNVRHFHANFFRHLREHTLKKYLFENITLDDYERFSINVFAWSGRDFAEFDYTVGHDDELWLSRIKAEELGRPAMICGDALFSHFAYYTQRAYLEANSNCLDVYAAIAEGRPPPRPVWE
jgi:hypothetical protein